MNVKTLQNATSLTANLPWNKWISLYVSLVGILVLFSQSIQECESKSVVQRYDEKYGEASKPWMELEENVQNSVKKVSKDVPEYIVDLDLPESERWTEIGQEYADRSYEIVDYLKDNLPDGLLEPLEKVAAKLLPFFRDYGDEMKGYAKALNITSGDIVMVNLVYQLEHLGKL